MSQRVSPPHQQRQIGYVVVCIAAPLLTTLLVVVATRDADPPQRDRVIAPPRPGELAAIEREARAQAAPNAPAVAPPPSTSRPLREAVPLDAIRPEVERHLAALETLKGDIDHFVANIDSKPLAAHGEFSREVNRRYDEINADSPLRRLEHGPLWEHLSNAEVEVRQSWFGYVFQGAGEREKWRSRAERSLRSARRVLEESASDTSP